MSSLLIVLSITALFFHCKYDAVVISLRNVQNELETTIEENNKLSEELANVNKELDDANKIIKDLKSSEYELVYMGEFSLTHYCVEKQAHICGIGNGKTYTGTIVTAGRTIAVDPKVVPLGSQVYIEGYGWRTAEDIGGAVDGNHIDIAVTTHDEANRLGNTNGDVWVLVKK